ncbi:CBS domain-containing protein [Siccirubricoccus sp. KC 17139]|uniref:CBS domain-containing protein n=1 Tax=Siccirubricoccus soli TaxID=2899147 RepID=A0ABT1D9I2_9PROT|nr:CBS domain-containing protein [Siccirubricoccus soli]MCO6418277.1 CBS domain-containing protein [Siccirubricoccus soli]MCP2684412.1 CBS domain-containing protein [Siccirubricoccus soli]
MIIGSILKVKGSTVIAVRPEDSILAVARTLDAHRIGAALVQDEAGRILGIISERDIIRGMAGHGPGTTGLPVSQFMTHELVTVRPETLVTEALALITQHRVRHLPVLDGSGALLGLVSIGDLVKARIEAAEQEAEALKDYVVSAG